MIERIASASAQKTGEDEGDVQAKECPAVIVKGEIMNRSSILRSWALTMRGTRWMGQGYIIHGLSSGIWALLDAEWSMRYHTMCAGEPSPRLCRRDAGNK